jgi:hypothetical protein
VAQPPPQGGRALPRPTAGASAPDVQDSFRGDKAQRPSDRRFKVLESEPGLAVANARDEETVPVQGSLPPHSPAGRAKAAAKEQAVAREQVAEKGLAVAVESAKAVANVPPADSVTAHVQAAIVGEHVVALAPAAAAAPTRVASARAAVRLLRPDKSCRRTHTTATSQPQTSARQPRTQASPNVVVKIEVPPAGSTPQMSVQSHCPNACAGVFDSRPYSPLSGVAVFPTRTRHGWQKAYKRPTKGPVFGDIL